MFYGAAANARAGERIATGDINRDTPNDLVILASGGSGGAGELDIYYGRARTSIGTVVGATRVVDFATAGQVSRRILGDPAAGPIASAQVYEVTGEGARDVIVGVPAIDGNTGKLFFTISPRLRVSRASETLVANKGGSATSSTAFAVTNPSVVVTGWQAVSSAAWLSASPSSGSVSQSAPGAFYIVAQAGSLPGGVYTGTLNISSTSPDLTMTLGIDVTFTVLDGRVAIDAPAEGATVSNGFTIAGWAVDLSAPSGTGINSVQAYAFPTAGGAQIYLGGASYGSARSDVGAIFGSRFTNSGYTHDGRQPDAGCELSPGRLRAQHRHQYLLDDRDGERDGLEQQSPPPVRRRPIRTRRRCRIPTRPAPGPNPGGGPTPNPDYARRRQSCGADASGAANNGALRTGAQTVTVSFTNGASTWSVASDDGLAQPVAGIRQRIGILQRVGEQRHLCARRDADRDADDHRARRGELAADRSGDAAPYAGTTAPIGLVDTPADNATGVIGSIPVTGWALDDHRRHAGRDLARPLTGEPASSANGKVFIGNAVFVDGRAARRRGAVSRQAVRLPRRLGLPAADQHAARTEGNGTFTLHAYAIDLEGNRRCSGRARSPATTPRRPSRSARSTRPARARRSRARATSTSAGR